MTTFILKHAKHCSTPSYFLQQFFHQNGFNIEYIPNPVALQKFPYNRAKIAPKSLLWVRAFSPVYRPQLAILILKEVQHKYPEATLTMVGPNKGELNNCNLIIDELNLKSSITITGAVDNNELHTYYQSHEIYLNTTMYESFGVALVEAASCGIPIVSAKVGEIPYLWQHKTSILLVEDDTASGFAEHIFSLFEDFSLANNISNNAQINSTKFTWEAIQERWFTILRN